MGEIVLTIKLINKSQLTMKNQIPHEPKLITISILGLNQNLLFF